MPFWRLIFEVLLGLGSSSDEFLVALFDDKDYILYWININIFFIAVQFKLSRFIYIN